MGASTKLFPIVATGNWGCGAFGGCATLKALLQWASASHCGRRLKYFPFDETFGPDLEILVGSAIENKATVGDLLSSLCEFRAKAKSHHVLPLNDISGKLQARLKKKTKG